MTEELIKEVDEALAQDRAADLWKKWSPYLFGAIALTIIGVAGYQFGSWQKSRQVEARAGAYAAALASLEAQDADKARGLLTEVAGGKDGFAEIAGHMLGGLEIEHGRGAEAAAALEGAASRSDELMGRIALLKAAYIKGETMSRVDLAKMVAPLVEDGGPLAALANELLAAKSLQEGDVEAARSQYRALSLDLEAPEQVRTRVQHALQTLPKPDNAAKAADAAPAAASSPAQGKAAQEGDGK